MNTPTDKMGKEIRVDDIIFGARTVYRSAELKVGQITRITDTRVYYVCEDENCDTKHWFNITKGYHRKVISPECIVVARNGNLREYVLSLRS